MQKLPRAMMCVVENGCVWLGLTSLAQVGPPSSATLARGCVLVQVMAAGLTGEALRSVGTTPALSGWTASGEAVDEVAPDRLPCSGSFGTGPPGHLSGAGTTVLASIAEEDVQQSTGRSSGRCAPLVGGFGVGRVVATADGAEGMTRGECVVYWSSPVMPVYGIGQLVSCNVFSCVSVPRTSVSPVALLSGVVPALRAHAGVERVPGGVLHKSVMVLDAGSPFGVAACQLAIALGATSVIAVTRTDAQIRAIERQSFRGALSWRGSSEGKDLPDLASAGVSVETVDCREGEEATLERTLRATGGGGVDVVWEPSSGCEDAVGMECLVRCCGPRGCVLLATEREGLEVDSGLAIMAARKGISVMYGASEAVGMSIPLRYDREVARVGQAVDLLAKQVIDVEYAQSLESLCNDVVSKSSPIVEEPSVAVFDWDKVGRIPEHLASVAAVLRGDALAIIAVDPKASESRSVLLCEDV
jgi:hypothetical protein